MTTPPTPTHGATPVLLRVRNLKTYFVTEHGKGTARAVDDVSFELYPGETLGIVGESGCGKTVTSLSILRLVPEPPGHVLPGSLIEFEGRNLLALPAAQLRASSTSTCPGAPRGPAPSRCCGWSASPTPTSASITIPISSRAACASAS